MNLTDVFKKKTSGQAARDRLKLVLVSDRQNCSPEIMDRIKNDEIDALLEEAVRITDENLRSQAYDKINRKIVDQAPWVYLWHCSESYVTSPRVKHIDFYPMFFCDKSLNIELMK